MEHTLIIQGLSHLYGVKRGVTAADKLHLIHLSTKRSDGFVSHSLADEGSVDILGKPPLFAPPGKTASIEGLPKVLIELVVCLTGVAKPLNEYLTALRHS